MITYFIGLLYDEVLGLSERVGKLLDHIVEILLIFYRDKFPFARFTEAHFDWILRHGSPLRFQGLFLIYLKIRSGIVFGAIVEDTFAHHILVNFEVQ